MPATMCRANRESFRPVPYDTATGYNGCARFSVFPGQAAASAGRCVCRRQTSAFSEILHPPDHSGGTAEGGTVSDGTGVFAATRTDEGYGCPSGRWITNRSCHKPDCRQVPDHVFRPARTTVFPVRPVGMSAVVTASPRRFAVVYRIPVT